GAFLVRGITPGEVIAQYLGKRGGPTKGKDSNVHIGDLKRGVIGFVSHLADNLPVATGVALAFKMRGESRVVITNTGDGGTRRCACTAIRNTTLPNTCRASCWKNGRPKIQSSKRRKCCASSGMPTMRCSKKSASGSRRKWRRAWSSPSAAPCPKVPRLWKVS